MWHGVLGQVEWQWGAPVHVPGGGGDGDAQSVIGGLTGTATASFHTQVGGTHGWMARVGARLKEHWHGLRVWQGHRPRSGYAAVRG